jgi:hypothetical protein
MTMPGVEFRCGARHPSNLSIVPCLLVQGHDGRHWSTSGCEGGTVSWVDAPTSDDEAGNLLARAEKAEATVARVEALIDPATGMATTPFGRPGSDRYFTERDIRAALAGER